MSDVIIRVEGLGKKYRIRHERAERYTALRDVIADKVRGVFSRGWPASGGVVELHNTTDTSAATGEAFSDIKYNFQSGSPVPDAPSVEDFWALRDVSFEVMRGEVVGIIGRNGAGKSTLLKILSRITEPTEGRVELDGRVASLLEVGTGFHPELTGRENIFLNGAILGMTRAEIKRKFDEIVAFAEVEKFLDTPVKRYSSGMYVRLAFSVAAHLEPEILVVDEVLAVGDAEFQRKCLGKMRDASRGGRTVLFVSHNVAAVQNLCGVGILLDRGQLVVKSNVSDVVARYLQSEYDPDADYGRVQLSKYISITRLSAVPVAVRHDGKILFTLELQANADELITDIALLIYASGGERVAIVDLRSKTGAYRLIPGTRLVIESQVTEVPLVEADYSLGLWVNANSVCQSFTNLLTFTVLPDEPKGGIVPREAEHRGFVELHTRVEATVVGKFIPEKKS